MENQGQGKLTFANGDTYVGEFQDGKQHGQGTLTFINGNRYVGEFKDAKANGQGKMTYKWRCVCGSISEMSSDPKVFTPGLMAERMNTTGISVRRPRQRQKHRNNDVPKPCECNFWWEIYTTKRRHKDLSNLGKRNSND